MANLRFDKGTLVLEGLKESSFTNIDIFYWDKRILAHRAPAFKYRQIVMFLKENNIIFQDYARKYSV